VTRSLAPRLYSASPTLTLGSADRSAVRDELRLLYESMVNAVLNDEGLEGVAELAARTAGGPVVIAIPGFSSACAPAENLSGGDLVMFDSWVGERVRGRPTPARRDIVAETPVNLQGRILGLVGLLRTAEPPRENAAWILDVAAAASLTALAVEEARLDAEHRLRGSFLELLRAKGELSASEIARRAARLGCDVTRGAIVLCVEVDGNRPRLVATAILHEHPGAFAEPVEPVGEGERSQVWAVVPAVAGQDVAQATEARGKRLASRLRQYGTVGLSRFHRDPGELGRGIDEAELMLGVLRKAAAPTVDEIVDGTYKLLFRLLASHPDELTNYHAATIGPLVRHDDQHRTDLMRTLEAYLDTNCNMNLTAEAIFAHRHTVAHRLERIKALSGLDASVHEDRERLGLGLKIHRLTA
jgi:sugar diacid utilization regulator